jgi:hypothetical protein
MVNTSRDLSQRKVGYGSLGMGTSSFITRGGGVEKKRERRRKRRGEAER